MTSNTLIIIAAVIIVIIIVGVIAYYMITRHSARVITTLSSTTVPTTNSTSTSTTSMSTSTTTSTTSSTSTSTTSITTTTSLPPGAIELPYNPSNHTVFLYIAVLNTGPTFNFNGTSNGELHIYIPANWTVIVYYTNEESALPHNFLIVQNDTPVPNSYNVADDGKILLYVGTSPSTYQYSGLSSGQSASGLITLPAGYYWFCCGIAGHAESGMWGVIISSSAVAVPYATGL